MKNLRPVRGNSFGWWLCDVEDVHPKVRPLGYSLCRVCQTDDRKSRSNDRKVRSNDRNDIDDERKDVDELRTQKLTSPTSIPSREELFELIHSGRLPHLERYQKIIETVLGSRPAIDDIPEDEFVDSRTPSTPSPVEIRDDDGIITAVEKAARSGYIDEEFAIQVSRLRELSAGMTELRSTSRLLHRELRELDAASARILSKIRSLRRDAEDLCFLDKMMAAAEGLLTLVPDTSNRII